MSDGLTPAQLDEIEATAKDEMDSGWRIVLMNPAATLALVTEVREMRAKVEKVQGIIGPRDLLDPHQGGCEGLADETLLSILDALGEEA